ncbi:MAG: hypothetical protein WC356_04470 [Candidatus Micrarchaeia archaeon]|jgi:hypothetical protein
MNNSLIEKPLTKTPYAGFNTLRSYIAQLGSIDADGVARVILDLEGHLMNAVKGNEKKLNDAVILYETIIKDNNFDPKSKEIFLRSFRCFKDDLFKAFKERKHSRENQEKTEYFKGICKYYMLLIETQKDFDKTEIHLKLGEIQEEYALTNPNDKNNKIKMQYLEEQGNFLIECIEFNKSYKKLYNTTTLAISANVSFQKLIDELRNEIKETKNPKEKEFYLTEIQTTTIKMAYVYKITNNNMLASDVINRNLTNPIDIQNAKKAVDNLLAENGY